MTDVSFDDMPDPMVALQTDNRRFDTRLLKVGLWALLAMAALTVLFLPAANQPLVELIRSGIALIHAGAPALLQTVAEWIGWGVANAIFAILMAIVMGVVWVGTTSWYVFTVIYEAVIAFYPLASAHAMDDGIAYRATAVPIVIAALPGYVLFVALCLLKVNGLAWPTRSDWSLILGALTALLVLALGTDICTFWLYHMNTLLGVAPAPPAATFMVGAVGFIIVFGMLICWSNHVQHQHAILSALTWQANEPQWVIVRPVICLVTPVVLMAGAYVLTYFIRNDGMWLIGMIGAALLETVVIRFTIGFGLWRRSTFSVKRDSAADFPIQEEPKLIG